MSQTVRRKAPSARKVAQAQGAARKVRTAKARTGSALDSVMAWLPISEEQLHRVFLAVFLGGGARKLEGLGLVAAPYEVDGKKAGMIGVLGPRRMQYSKLTAVVEFTAGLVGRLLTRLSG